MKTLRLFVEDGSRVCLLVSEGVRYAHLLHVPSLAHLKMDHDEFLRQGRTGLAVEVEPSRGLITRILESRSRALGSTPPRRFSDAFVQEVLAVLRGEKAVAQVEPLPTEGEAGAALPAESAPATQAPPAAPAIKVAPPKRATNPRPFDLPARAEVRMPKLGKRLTVFQMLQRPEGATLEQIQAATGWDRQNAVSGTRLINSDCGYGLRQDEGGAIHVILPAA